MMFCVSVCVSTCVCCLSLLHWSYPFPLIPHQYPSVMFTEDYQLQFHANYFDTFDEYRGKFLIGELIWNFADFMTDQGECVTIHMQHDEGLPYRWMPVQAVHYGQYYK